MKEDAIISALIGLVGACNNNGKTPDTDRLLLKALAFLLLHPEADGNALQGIIDGIHAEKISIAPGCATCTAPCGNTSDYDMRRIDTAEEGIRQAKRQIVKLLQELAAHVCGTEWAGASADIDIALFYKALSYVSYDMEESALLGLLGELKHLAMRISCAEMR